jgi:hypothetical protein
MPPLRREEARENSLQVLFFKGIGIILFLWSRGRADKIQLRLILTGGPPVFGL